MTLTAKKVILSDGPTQICLVRPLAAWGLVVWEAWFADQPTTPSDLAAHADSIRYLAIGAIVATLVLPFVARWRLRHVQSMLKDAVTVVGTVTKIGSVSTHGWVRMDYAYEVDGVEYKQATSQVVAILDAWKLVPGGPIELLVPPSHPAKSFIKADFVDGPRDR